MLSPKTMTPEEFLAYEAQHDNILFNFDDGKIIAVAATVQRSRISVEFMAVFNRYIQENPIGEVYGRVLHVLNGTMYQPDVCIQTSTTKDYFVTPPFVAAEIRTDPLTKSAQRRKALAYIENGVKMSILVFPGEWLEVHRPDREPLSLSYGDTLDGDDVLPGFKAAVSELL